MGISSAYMSGVAHSSTITLNSAARFMAFRTKGSSRIRNDLGCVQTWASELVTSSKCARNRANKVANETMIIVYLSVPSKRAGNGVRQGAGWLYTRP